MSQSLQKALAFFCIAVVVLSLAFVFRGDGRTRHGLVRTQDFTKESLTADTDIKQVLPGATDKAGVRQSEDKLPAQLVPPMTRIQSTSSKTVDGLRENTIKLESSLRPWELQIFYTDGLVEDWIIWRDTLTEGVGWSGVFLQIEGKERRLGVFANVLQLGAGHSGEIKTTISILEVSEV